VICHRCFTYCEGLEKCESCGSVAFFRGTPLMEFKEIAFPMTFGSGKKGFFLDNALHYDNSRRTARPGSRVHSIRRSEW
jgi:hypothetical protein